MEVWTTTDPGHFAERAREWLAANPVHGNLFATTADALARAGTDAAPGGEPWFAGLDVGGRVVCVAMRGPYGTAVGPGPDGAHAALAQALHDAGLDTATVTGERSAAEAFVAHWTTLHAVRAQVAMAEAVHLLGTLRPPSGVPGAARPAGPGDLDLAVRWLDDFAAEAVPYQPRQDPAVARARLAARLDEGRLLLWEVDGTPVSTAYRHGPVHGAGRVGPVWTPPEHRRHGYAAAVTAASTQALLDAGATTCLLYTDLANPTSNGVYARIGYERTADAVEYRLVPRDR